jgi:Fe-S cluster biosynthesis and repair protein YggX
MTVKTVDIRPSQAIMGIALFAAIGLSGWQFWKNEDTKVKTELKTNLTEQEIRLLQQELATARHELLEEKTKPSYDDGYRACILSMGGAQQNGSYKDGWDAAVKMLNNRSYADGYHNAIEQFGYQTQGKQIVPKNEPESSAKTEPKK